MFLYNVTIIVEEDVHEDVRQHIEAQLLNKQAMPHAVTLLEMLESPHEGITYCVQLRSESRHDITSFQQQYLSPFQQLTNSKYPGKTLFFDSIMKYLNQGQ